MHLNGASFFRFKGRVWSAKRKTALTCRHLKSKFLTRKAMDGVSSMSQCALADAEAVDCFHPLQINDGGEHQAVVAPVTRLLDGNTCEQDKCG